MWASPLAYGSTSGGGKLFARHSGISRAVGYLALVLMLGVAAAVLAACGDSATPGETTETGGLLGEPMTSIVTDGSDSGATETSAATDGVDAGLVGKWYSAQTGETFEFTSDGRLIVTDGDGGITELTYTADGSNISYLLEGAVVYTGTYAIDGDVLSQVDPGIAGTVYFDRVD